jgi:hypothetical protein
MDELDNEDLRENITNDGVVLYGTEESTAVKRF